MTIIDLGSGYSMVRQDGANFYYTYTFTGIDTGSATTCTNLADLNTFTSKSEMEARGWTFADNFAFKPGNWESHWIDSNTEFWGGVAYEPVGWMKKTLTGSGTITIDYGVNWWGIVSIELNDVEKDVLTGNGFHSEVRRTVSFDFVDGDVLKLVEGGNGQPSILVLRSITLNCAAVSERECVDSDNGSIDVNFQQCPYYRTHPTECGIHDDDDFTSNVMCCACGGGVSEDFVGRRLLQENKVLRNVEEDGSVDTQDEDESILDKIMANHIVLGGAISGAFMLMFAIICVCYNCARSNAQKKRNYVINV